MDQTVNSTAEDNGKDSVCTSTEAQSENNKCDVVETDTSVEQAPQVQTENITSETSITKTSEVENSDVQAERLVPTEEGKDKDKIIVEQPDTPSENLVPSEMEVNVFEQSATLSDTLAQQQCKEEPSDIDMEKAEDFTKTSALASVPQANVEQKNTSIQEQIAKEQAVESQAIVQIANSSLSLLTQYISSDSDAEITDSDEEQLSRQKLERSSSSSSSESSDDDVVIIPNAKNYRAQDAILVSDAETLPNDDDAMGSSDDESISAQPIRAKGETLIHELPPIEELTLSVSETECKLVGIVQSIVAQIVIVQSNPGVELLDLDTVLFLEKGKRALGKIFDVIGQVTAPMYCVLFNSRQHVNEKGIVVGTPVYCAPQTEHTSFIILSDLMKNKGSDASWLDDHEAPPHALDFSDDEQERRSRGRRNSSSSNGRQTPDDGQRQFHRRRGNYRGRGRGHSWHHNIGHQPAQRVLNPFAVGSGSSLPPPPPPPPYT